MVSRARLRLQGEIECEYVSTAQLSVLPPYLVVQLKPLTLPLHVRLV